LAWYAAATVIGALGATYAAVPLYKVFCQTTGFGGTTQRVNLADWAEKREARESSGGSRVSQALWDKLISMSDVPREMLPTSVGTTSHGRGGKTWTDEEAAEKLASLRPRKDGRLITVRFDSTVGDNVSASRSRDYCRVRPWTCRSFFSLIQRLWTTPSFAT
jgi:hypothetical protein